MLVGYATRSDFDGTLVVVIVVVFFFSGVVHRVQQVIRKERSGLYAGALCG